MGQEQSCPVDESTPPQTLVDRSIDSVAKHIKGGGAKKIVVMVGAGMSTSAGIPDFRSPDTGLYANLSRLNLPYAEAVFDISYFRNNPLPFYTLAHELYPGKYRPTISHSFVRLLSDKGLLLKLFTQNIDCLDREAGVPAEKIVEAHGSFARQRCIECKTPFPGVLMKQAISKSDVPHCLTPQCNGLVKPDIVFFGEQLPENFHSNRGLPRTADLCIVMGTSLTVQPFASLPGFCSEGVPRVLINLERVGGFGSRPDDVMILEDCDTGVRKLASALGWEEELQALWNETKAGQIALDDGGEEPPQKSKDEKLQDQITSLTEEVDKSLKISNEHQDWLTEHLSEKQKKWDQNGEAASSTETFTVKESNIETSSRTDREDSEARTPLHSTSEDPFKVPDEANGGSESDNTTSNGSKKSIRYHADYVHKVPLPVVSAEDSMTSNTKRKWRFSSKSLFGSQSTRKVVVLDRPTLGTQDGTCTPSAVSNISMDGCGSNDGPGRRGVAARMRHNGSKLLSFVGFQRNSDVRMINTPSNAPSERDVALAIARDAATSSTSMSSPGDAIRALKELDIFTEKKPAPLSVPRTPSARSPLSETDIEDVSIADNRGLYNSPSPTELPSAETSSMLKEPLGLGHSTSNASFAHQLSQKISSTFGNPTIVHRPYLRTRPPLLEMSEDPSPKAGARSDLELSPQDSSAPSSYNFSGSVSATEPSTGKTSLESNTASLRSAIAAGGNEKPAKVAKATAADEIAREKPLTPIQEAPPVVTPTMATVETTANAKIFFETHFNSLLAGNATPRSIRKKDLEARLEALAMPEEQCQQERLAWAIYESEHLRQTRVLKGKTNEMAKDSGVAVAGYEVVRILGKGSFGVVRLVREVETFQDDPAPMSSTLPTVPVRSPSGRQDHNSPRMTAMEALRATLDSHKITHRWAPKKARREVYAMKVIRKSDMLRNCQEGHLRAERDFLVASEKSRWVVPLVASFQDLTNLYLVMEYMVGGDFLGLLFRKDILKERHARWYIAEMILCVEEAHKLRWIHRDVKPDNFLISASGHLKISDFGLAFDGHWAHDQRYFKSHRQLLMEKLGIEVRGDVQDQEEDAKKDARTNLADILSWRRGRQEKAQVDDPSEQESILQWRNRYGKRRLAGSVVGTSQYMAPEVVRGDPYDGRCDWWSIGIILYECLYGFTPFVSEKREDTKAKILNNATTLIFPDEREVERKEKVSYDAMELINSLLQEKEHRICSKKYRLNDYQHSRRPPGKLIAKRSDPLAQDYQGNYVYPDDAEDIKAHRFFHRIGWERLHLSRPPFVPDVSGLEDTKYFDEDEPISDVDDAASQSDVQEASDVEMADVGHENARVTQVDGAQGQEEVDGDQANNGQKEAAKKKTEKKRPRDKVLRDKDVGRGVLKIRKQGGFLGYEYRRPKLNNLAEEERGRQRAAKRSLIPSFE